MPAPKKLNGQRRQFMDALEDPSERDYSFEEILFMDALEDYKRDNGRMFPTCSEILQVVKALGYENHSLPVDACHAPSPVARSRHGSP